MNPNLRNLFMKKLTRLRVVPTISANVPCEIWGTIFCGLSSLPYLATSNKARANRFSLELKS
jgi:hypothetical protein